MSTGSKLEALLNKCEQVAIESGAHQSYRACRDAFKELREAIAASEQEQAGEAVAVPNLDPDGDTSRAGFAAMDAELVARWMSPWQVWREAVRWSTGQRAIHGITKESKT